MKAANQAKTNRAATAKANRAAKAELKRMELEAAAAAAAEEGEEEDVYTMSKQLIKYRARYQLSIAASGAKSLNNGDALAKFLEMKTGAEVCALADKFVPLKSGTHLERYARLNEGQKRMNAGNKLRAALKNELITVDDKGIKAVKVGKPAKK